MIKPNLKTIFPAKRAVIPAFAVFPAKAGNQSYYEVQSPLNDELDTRMREYDGSTYDGSTNDDSIHGETA